MLWQEVNPVCFRVANDLVTHKKERGKVLEAMERTVLVKLP